MADHQFQPSGFTAASGQPLDSCLRCGHTEASHLWEPSSELLLVWGGRELRFKDAAEARAAGFHPEVGR
jgi:hypothetical protein